MTDTGQPSSHPCTRKHCTGTAFLSPFVLRDGTNILGDPLYIPGQLWECNTCGALWNTDGTPYRERTP